MGMMLRRHYEQPIVKQEVKPVVKVVEKVEEKTISDEVVSEKKEVKRVGRKPLSK